MNKYDHSGYLIIKRHVDEPILVNDNAKFIYYYGINKYLYIELGSNSEAKWKAIQKAGHYKNYQISNLSETKIFYVPEMPTHVIAIPSSVKESYIISERQKLGEPTFLNIDVWLIFTHDLSFIMNNWESKIYKQVIGEHFKSMDLIIKHIKLQCHQMKNLIEFDTDKDVLYHCIKETMIIRNLLFKQECSLTWGNQDYMEESVDCKIEKSVLHKRTNIYVDKRGFFYLNYDQYIQGDKWSDMYINDVSVKTSLKNADDNAVLVYLCLKDQLGGDVAKMIARMYYWDNSYL
tara:strand:+ start:140709 stop:141578 length:870 start_codon:yes stop_codon:yes gene_type:complete